MELREPRPLSVGSLVAVVAPAGPFNRDWLFSGLAWLQTRYRLRIAANIFERYGYLAGSDDRRRAELAQAMIDPDVDAILCARGGYGTMRILDRLPWGEFARAPKWLVGFSDVTALHIVANVHGAMSLHGPNGPGFRLMSAQDRYTLLQTLEGKAPARSWNLDVVREGDAEGPLFGGNLALVAAMAAAGRLVVPKGAIVVLEDITEKPYRVDRMLTSLLLGGHLANASAIVFGEFTECGPGEDGMTVDDVIVDRTSALGIPIVKNAPFGHDKRNEPFVLGRTARLAKGTLSL